MQGVDIGVQACVCRGGPLPAALGLDRGAYISLEQTSLGAAVKQCVFWVPLDPQGPENR